MAFGAQPLDSASVPMSCAYIPGDAFYAVQGAYKSTDGSSNSSVAILFAPVTSATSTLTSVASSATTVSLLALNTARKGAYVYNDSTSVLYLAFATTASITAYTTQIPAGAFWEMPTSPVYTGAISGIWSSANGNARLTELT